jgi:predicted RNA binding protein YcfA (HicA-like mRNA interferase family)
MARQLFVDEKSPPDAAKTQSNAASEQLNAGQRVNGTQTCKFVMYSRACVKSHIMFRELTEFMKVRDVIKMIEEDGWYIARTRGSHRQFKHPRKPGLVTIAGHSNVDIPRGTLNSIRKQAGLKTE